MKRLLFVLILMLLFLSACTAIGTATSSVEVLQTSIALTQTANPTRTPGQPPISTSTLLPSPTHTPWPSPTSTAAAPPLLNPPGAVNPPAGTWNPYYADQFIYYYFQHINNRDYGTTWSLLTEAFKAAVNGPEKGGYTGYVDYWNTVQRVDVKSVYLSSFNGYYADVTVNMVYNYFNGTVAPAQVPFHLAYDSSRGTWMFNAYSTTAPAYPSTPSQFIYYYFNNINLRNYGFTWSLLTDSFINNNNSPEQGGYEGYVNFWNTVARIDVVYVTVTSESSGYADVTVGLTYNYTNGSVASTNLPFHLVYNSTISSWQFYSP
jgi:hypothetical protein